MGYIDKSYVEQITEELRYVLDINKEHCQRVAWAIRDAAEDGLSQLAYNIDHSMDTVEREIRHDMSENLNTAMEWTRLELDRIEDTFGPALSAALSALADSNLLGQQATVDNLELSYESVQETTELVGTSIDTVVTESAQAIQDTQASVGEHIDTIVAASTTSINQTHALVETALTEQNNTLFETIMGLIGSVGNLPETIVTMATDYFLPLLGMMFNEIFNAVLLGNPLESVIKTATAGLGAMIEGLFDFDESAIQGLVNKYQNMFAQHLTGLLKT